MVSLSALRQTRHAATPIRMYSTVHTGPNTSSGGLKDGLMRPEYQLSTLVAAIEAPSAPTPRQSATNKAKPMRSTKRLRTGMAGLNEAGWRRH